ncbi:GSCOCG00011855001-RA-CDS, partial [Cotesia congregata]
MLNRDLIVTKKFLKENSDLVVSKSDKGNSTVIMFKEEYEREMGVLINDRTTYQPLHRDPTLKFQKRANDLVADLSSTGIIDEAEAKILQSNYTLAPRIYGLRKTHKPTCKLRPVVSCVQSPSYKLSRFVHEILTPVVEKFRFNLQNSFQFVEFSKTVELENDYRLISLDVVSLFTNIRKDLVLKVINETWDNIKHLVKVPKDKLIKLVEFCFETSYFSFGGTLYGQ